MTPNDQQEPWLRGTLSDLPAVPRAVIHALELAREDIDKWCGELSDVELNARVSGIPPLSFHLKHIGGSMDRLLTYAEGSQLSSEQIAAMKYEIDSVNTGEKIFADLRASFERGIQRILTLATGNLEEARTVGRKQLPTSVGGLLVHVADHTQRHTGQAVTTAKIIRATRGS
ncbi:MAG TPA: DinB family protein [Candidatus Acidoferrales bacterium]|nr:DinB family protein [Candidatus Acidoferrales bacterium]